MESKQKTFCTQIKKKSYLKECVCVSVCVCTCVCVCACVRVRERERVQSVCCVFVQIIFAEQLALHFLPIALGLVKSDFKQNVFI